MLQITGSRSHGLQHLQQVGSAWALEQGSIVMALGSVAPWHAGASQNRD